MPHFMIFAMKIVRIVERKRGSKKKSQRKGIQGIILFARGQRTIFQQFHLWIE